jgi:hypothetical protein
LAVKRAGRPDLIGTTRDLTVETNRQIQKGHPAMKPARLIAFTTLAALRLTLSVRADDPLPSWNDGATKQSIVDFVGKLTKEGSPDFVPVAERIATFDNDGTLWCEQPMYFQLIFALDHVKALAPKHPERKDKEPFASLLKGDVKGALAGRRNSSSASGGLTWVATGSYSRRWRASVV